MPRRDLVHVTFAKEAGALRGVGPLQLCGAALSVAAEADEWAANYFAGGGVPSVLLRPNYPINEAEAQVIKTAWISTPPNQPKVAGDMEVDVMGHPQQAELTATRLANVGEAARMFGIPAPLLAYAVAGSSLTYQNLASVGTDLVRFTLAPGYLEPIEQAMSDLLPRSTVARFRVDGLQRADPAGRMDVYEKAISLGMMTPAQAAALEGWAPGGVEYEPVPPNVAAPRLPGGIDT